MNMFGDHPEAVASHNHKAVAAPNRAMRRIKQPNIYTKVKGKEFDILETDDEDTDDQGSDDSEIDSDDESADTEEQDAESKVDDDESNGDGSDSESMSSEDSDTDDEELRNDPKLCRSVINYAAKIMERLTK
jgi:hypothetical protein